MPDPIEPEMPAATTEGPQSEAMAPPKSSDAVKRTTHEVDADDMFSSTT